MDGITNNTSEKRCYTVKELQEILGISRPTVYELLKMEVFSWLRLEPPTAYRKTALINGLMNRCRRENLRSKRFHRCCVIMNWEEQQIE